MRNKAVEMVDGAINCPTCGQAWARADEDSAWIEDATSCPHLRFAIEPDGTGIDEIHFFNGMTGEKLLAAVETAYRRLYPEQTDLTSEEIFGEALSDDDFWEKAATPEFDAIFSETQEGMACGPVSSTVFFGAKLGE